MSAAAPQVLDLQRLWADETLDHNVDHSESTDLAAASRSEGSRRSITDCLSGSGYDVGWKSLERDAGKRGSREGDCRP